MAISRQEFSVIPLIKAHSSLREVLKKRKNKIVRDATIQRFEYTFELSWKVLKRYFQFNNNLREENIKNIFREAGKQGLIDSVEDWFGFQEARNETSHTYNEAIAERVFAVAKVFSPACGALISNLEKSLGAKD